MNEMRRHHGKWTVVAICFARESYEQARKLVATLPADPSCAYVLLQGGDPSFAAPHAARALDSWSPTAGLRVMSVADEAILEPGCLYMASPGQRLQMDKCVLRASSEAAMGLASSPIDECLHGLAQEFGQRAVCIMLTRDMRDGLRGLQAIKAAGGATIVAQYEPIPSDSVIALAHQASLVERMVPIERMLETLRALVAANQMNQDFTSSPGDDDLKVGHQGERSADGAAVTLMDETLEQRVAEPSDDALLLHEIAMAANTASSVHEMMQFTVDRVCRAMDCCAIHLYLPSGKEPDVLLPSKIWCRSDPDKLTTFRESMMGATFVRGRGVVGRVYDTGEPECIEDVAQIPSFLPKPWESSLRGALIAPVQMGRTVVGVIAVFSRERIRREERLLRLMINIGTHLGRVIERKRWENEFTDAIAEQQRTFGQELHDGVGQELTGLAYLARNLHQRLHDAQRPEAGAAEQLLSGIQNALVHVRTMSRGMFPVEMDADGLMSALTALSGAIERQYGVACKFECDAPVAVHDSSVAIHLFRIAQEAINNAVKHGQAKNIVVELTVDEEQIKLKVSNDGLPFPVSKGEQQTGIGLRTMRYRAGIVGAQFDIFSGQEGGATIICTLKQEEGEPPAGLRVPPKGNT